MFVSTFDPLNNIWLSSAVAAIPIILFLLSLTVFKMKGINAALLTLIVTLVLSLMPFNLPIGVILAAIIQGVVQGFYPIGYIIIMAVWLYRLTVASGKFEVIKASLAMVSPDQRIQLLLIGFCFGAFLEGAAGFGVPIAICSIMLAALGFNPLQAAMLCLIANAAPGAFGAIGVPVAIVDTFNLHNVTALGVSRMTNTMLPFVAASVPFLMIWILDGFRGIKETLPALLVTSITFTLSQMLVTYFLGAELADILPPVLALGALAGLSRKWQPKRIFRLVKEDKNMPKYSIPQIIMAWMPFYLLSGTVIVWSLPIFKHLFVEGATLHFSQLHFELFNDEQMGKIAVDLELFKATGTAILVAALITIAMSTKELPIRKSGEILWQTIKSLWLSVLTISFILVIAKLTTLTGMTQALGEAVSATGSIFPLLSPSLGWVGVFMTGSVVNNNTLFAPIQSIVAEHLHINPELLVAANTAGGTMAKLVSPQSIAIATAAVEQAGQESTLLKMTLKYSLGLLVFVCIWTFVLSLMLA